MRKITLLMIFAVCIFGTAIMHAQTFKQVTEEFTQRLDSTSVANADWISATNNWVARNDCGNPSDLYFNLSQSSRNITLHVSNAQSFTLSVANSTAGRQWNYSINGATPVVITHPGGGCVQTEVEIEDPGNVTIVISSPSASSASVYPAIISFTPAEDEGDDDDVCDYFEDFETETKGVVSGQILAYDATNQMLTFDLGSGASGNRLGTYTLDAGGIDFEEKAVVEFDYFTTSTYGGTGPFVLSFRDASNAAVFSLYTNNSGSSGNQSTIGVAAGPLDANGQIADLPDAQKKNLADITIPAGNVTGRWFNIQVEVDLVKATVTFTITGIAGTDYSATETLDLPFGYSINDGIRTMVFNSFRTANNYGAFKLTNLCMKVLDVQKIIYELYEPFDDVTAPWEFTSAGNTNITIETIDEPYGNVLQFAQASSESGRRINFKTDINWAPKTEGTDGYLYTEFDWFSGSPTNNTGGFIRFMNGSTDADAVFTVGIQGNSDNILFGNLVPGSQTDIGAAGIRITPSEGSFVRSDWYHVSACLDFAAKKIVKFTMTNSAGNMYEASNVDFINPNATAITRMEIVNGRTGGSNGGWPLTQMDNLYVYHVVPDDLTYDSFMDYVETVQAIHDGETTEGAFIAAIKGSLQTAINTGKSSVTEASTGEELSAAKATLEAAVATFFEAKSHYAALQTAIGSVTGSYNTASERVGIEFLNYTEEALTALNAAIVAANTALTTAETLAAIDAAKATVEGALATFNATPRRDPMSSPYRIYSYGIPNAGAGDGEKRILYSENENAYQILVSEATGDENDSWKITKGTSGYFIQNTVTGKYLARTDNDICQTEAATEVTIVNNSTQSNAIYKDDGYFLYGIIGIGGDRALELNDADAKTLRWNNPIANRARFAFQFETEVSKECDLLTVSAWGQTGTIDDATVQLTYSYAWKDFVHAIPLTFTLSPLATASITSGDVIDFTSGSIKITVIAQDGVTSKEYTVEVGFETYIPTENDFAPVAGKYYRIINKGSGVGSTVNLTGAAKYLYLDATTTLMSTTTLDPSDESQIWDIVKTSDFTYSIKNVGKGVYLGSAGQGNSSSVTGAETNENYLLPYARTDNGLDYYIIAYPTPGASRVAKQVRPQSSFAGWYWDAGIYPLDRADMIYTFDVVYPVAIDKVTAEKVIVSKEYFDFLGQPVSKDTKGLVIEKVTYKDGSQSVQKLFVK